MDQVTNIFEACNFQDISGQRIRKVTKVLETIETKVIKLVAMFGSEHEGVKTPTAEPKGPLSDQELLNGPQLDGAPTQDDVDRLFNNS
jgi:chemotaxis protein CheZ